MAEVKVKGAVGWTRERAQKLKLLAHKLEAMNLVPRTGMVQGENHLTNLSFETHIEAHRHTPVMFRNNFF